METVETLIKRYLNGLTREINLMLDEKKAIGDFISRFYFFIDEMPSEIPKDIVDEIENLNDVVSRYEPNLNKRKKESVYTGEKEIKKEALALLKKLNMF